MGIQAIIRDLPTLKQLTKLRNDQERRKFLSSCKRMTIYSICEICRNIVRGNIPISTFRKRQLKKYREHIRELSKKSISLKKNSESTRWIFTWTAITCCNYFGSNRC